MDEQTAPRRPIILARHEDDHSLITRGQLIPLQVQPRLAAPLVVRAPRALMLTQVVALCLTMLGIGALYAPALSQLSVSDLSLATALAIGEAPELKVEDPYTGRAVAPNYGPAERYAERPFYEKTRSDLVAAGVSFIDIDTVNNQAKLFVRGVLETDVSLLKTPSLDSWCTVPAGLYQVEDRAERHFSSFLDAYLPYSVVFYGNRFLHGWPQASDKSAVAETFERDCLRVADDAAEQFFTASVVGMPVLVHAAPKERPVEPFSYESKIKDFSTPYYLIADLSDDTILAVGKRYEAVPIASLTKLMTALVVLDEMSLDSKVAITEPSLIETVVPRLHDRSRVSVHTLLELLLKESSNEAAEVLASAMGREQFIAKMNERASALGLADTTFTDPSGLGASNVSSVNDLWWLVRYIHDYYPFIIELTRGGIMATSTVNATSTATSTPSRIPAPSDSQGGYGELLNFNPMENVDSFIGGKVGETEAALQTSVSLHRLSFGGTEREIIIVLLRSQARTDDVKELLAYLTERFGE
jgi:D-alanyl-D-alanine carboxypeptidase